MQELQSRRYPIREDMEFQRTSWVVERVGWAVLVLLLLVALTGLFGQGVLSKRTAAGAALRVDYERFQRVTKVTTYTIHLANSGEQTIILGPKFQTNYEIADIQPHPIRSGAGANGLELTFASAGNALTAVIRAHPRGFGRIRFDISNGGERLPLRPFVYP